MQKISPFLWFDKEAQAAAEFYTSIFPDARVTRTVAYPANSPHGEPGTVMTVEFQIFGQNFVALNGGPHFKLNGAISFVIHCETQEEVDRYWGGLTEGGEEIQCGWLKDRFGLTWQVVPTILDHALASDDPAVAERVFGTMMGMVKLDVAPLQRAYEGS